MQELKTLLLYSTVINIIILLVWLGMFIGAREWMYKLHCRWFTINSATFDAKTVASAHFLSVDVASQYR